MQNVAVETTQNVQIKYQLASIGDRILATLVDWLVFVGYFFLAYLVLLPFDENIPPYLLVILFLPTFLYHFICEAFFDGQSIGKKQMNVKVMKLDGSRPNIGGYLLRWMVRPLDFFMYGAVAMICISITGKGQRLGDLAAGTTVVKLKPRVKLDPNEPFNFPEDHVMTFPEVRRLDDQQAALIRESLSYYRDTGNILPLLKIYEQVKSHLGVSTDLPAVKFLHTILKDYSHYCSQGYH